VDPFEFDCALVGTENRYSGDITHVRTDIPGKITPCNKVINGFGESRKAKIWTGTILSYWDDDQEITHKMVIPNSNYKSEGQVRLMSPQPWAQTHSNSNKHHGTGSENTGNKVKLFWNNQRNTQTSPMNASGIALPLFDYCQRYFNQAAYCARINKKALPLIY
jgi:hypothetical protein